MQQQPTVEKNAVPVVKQKTNSIVPVAEQKKKDDAVAVQNNQPKQTQQPFVQQPDNQSTVKTEITAKNNSAGESNIPTIVTVQPETSIAKTSTSFVSNEDAGDEDEQVGLLNENRQRSSGLKGFLKKAKRTLERRTGVQSGDSQVRFAMFTVNTQ